MSDKVYSALEALVECLKKDTPVGEDEFCFIGIIPGDQVAHDYGFGGDCGLGMAWVRLINSYPAVTPGSPDERPGNCGSQEGIEVEVGILRPYAFETQLSAEIATDAVVGQYADKTRMRRAILCCDAFSNKDLRLGTYNPVGPLGLVFGGIYTFAAVV